MVDDGAAMKRAVIGRAVVVQDRDSGRIAAVFVDDQRAKLGISFCSTIDRSSDREEACDAGMERESADAQAVS